MSDIAKALIAGYNLTWLFAWFLTIGGFFLIRQWGKLCLSDLARHNCVEHDASLVHHNAADEADYAPCHIDDQLVHALCSHAKTPRDGDLALNAEDLARVRVHREKVSPPLDTMHAEIARGEMAIALGLFGGLNGAQDGIPVEWLREWIKDERIPRGWKSTHRQGFLVTIRASGVIRAAMKKLVEEEEEDESKNAQEFTIDTDFDAGSSTDESVYSPLFSPTTERQPEPLSPATSEDENVLVEKKPSF
jgi:hypothetical protein